MNTKNAIILKIPTDYTNSISARSVVSRTEVIDQLFQSHTVSDEHHLGGTKWKLLSIGVLVQCDAENGFLVIGKGHGGIRPTSGNQR